MTQYKPGYLVCLILHQTSLLKTSSRMVRVIYIGPMVVHKIIDKFQSILMDIEDKILSVSSTFKDLSKHFKSHKRSR